VLGFIEKLLRRSDPDDPGSRTRLCEHWCSDDDPDDPMAGACTAGDHARRPYRERSVMAASADAAPAACIRSASRLASSETS
jgi:hypothetical protein